MSEVPEFHPTEVSQVRAMELKQAFLDFYVKNSSDFASLIKNIFAKIEKRQTEIYISQKTYGLILGFRHRVKLLEMTGFLTPQIKAEADEIEAYPNIEAGGDYSVKSLLKILENINKINNALKK